MGGRTSFTAVRTASRGLQPELQVAVDVLDVDDRVVDHEPSERIRAKSVTRLMLKPTRSSRAASARR